MKYKLLYDLLLYMIPVFRQYFLGYYHVIE
jgi:hypothetical protein